MEEYVKISRENYDQFIDDSEAFKLLIGEDNVLIIHQSFGFSGSKTFYTLADESDFKSAIESKDKQIKSLRGTITKLMEVEEYKKEGFWRSFATAIYRTPPRKRKY